MPSFSDEFGRQNTGTRGMVRGSSPVFWTVPRNNFANEDMGETWAGQGRHGGTRGTRGNAGS